MTFADSLSISRHRRLNAGLILTLAAFFVLAQVRAQDNSETIDAFDGLGKRSPMLAVAMTIARIRKFNQPVARRERMQASTNGSPVSPSAQARRRS